MRIAFFSKQLPSDYPNGVSVQVDRLATALAGLGHEVTCFSFSPRPASATYGHVQLEKPSVSRLFGKFQPALAFRSVDKSGFDILHYHGDDYLCAGTRNRVRTFYGSALFEALHAGRPGRFLYQALFYKLEWISYLRRGQTAAISAATRRALPLVREVIPCGVPLDRYSPDISSKTTWPSILFIGDFGSRKKGELLLDAFVKEVLPRFPDCRLTIVGPASCIAPNLTCHSGIGEEELIAEYRRAWIYCMPSSYEGFGVPAIEAMACGTAVVAASNRGTREVLTDGENAVLCPPAGLGMALNRVIGEETLRKQLVSKGLETVKRFEIVETARGYEALYQKIMDD